jgi:hypothetical protein
MNIKIRVGLLLLAFGILRWLFLFLLISIDTLYTLIRLDISPDYKIYFGEHIVFAGILFLGIYLTNEEFKRIKENKQGDAIDFFSSSVYPILGKFLLIFGLVFVIVGWSLGFYLNSQKIYGTIDIDIKVFSILSAIIGAYLLRLSSFEKK